MASSVIFSVDAKIKLFISSENKPINTWHIILRGNKDTFSTLHDLKAKIKEKTLSTVSKFNTSHVTVQEIMVVRNKHCREKHGEKLPPRTYTVIDDDDWDTWQMTLANEPTKYELEGRPSAVCIN